MVNIDLNGKRLPYDRGKVQLVFEQKEGSGIDQADLSIHYQRDPGCKPAAGDQKTLSS